MSRNARELAKFDLIVSFHCHALLFAFALEWKVCCCCCGSIASVASQMTRVLFLLIASKNAKAVQSRLERECTRVHAPSMLKSHEHAHADVS